MAYYSGTANDMTALRQALINTCTQPAEGWSWDSVNEVLSKGSMFLRLQVVSGYLRLAGRTSATAGDTPKIVQIGPFTASLWPLPALTYPISYELFVFAQEVYCVINYAVDCYQWCAWGKSTVQGLPGTGMWLGATAADALTNYPYGFVIGNQDGKVNSGSTLCGALFWQIAGSVYSDYVHSDLDAQGWWWGQSSYADPVGILPSAPLIGLLPNAWNSEAVLLPIRAYKVRPSYKLSLTVDLEHARYTRVDSYAPGQIITIGTDRWKVFPWFRKDSTARNGGANITHTGTYGWAIRYEGL